MHAKNLICIIIFLFIDINECELKLHNCSHICVNNIGSFNCRCHDGFHLVGKSECLGMKICIA